ncbi:hypothetical protein C8J57DRAFT_1236678 [Mycena rebaudengoi]|nr:hypothetical protein C8J57DRAFT_1236678 [Mycena rebaudengoi]
MQEITKQFRVSENRDITQLPSTCLTLPRKDEGEDFAYRLYLTGDPQHWCDLNGEKLSMAAIIKSQFPQDQDAWGGGSGGHSKPSKATKVSALGGVLVMWQITTAKASLSAASLNFRSWMAMSDMSRKMKRCASCLRRNEP